jgi:3',5'-cyclic AMP phosphodiesterase CpdA
VDALTILQVSDTHLSRTHAYFQDNWDAFVDCVAEEQPDLVFVTGDMCFNGPVNPDDLVFAREQLDRIPAPWRAIPGNHDIGDVPPDAKLKHPISPERRDAYRAQFGEEYWVEERGGWRFIGLNAQLMGSGLADEADQIAFLTDALASAGDRSVALLIHKPLFHASPRETEKSTSTVYPEPRAVLLDLCRKYRVKLVASGHRHCYRKQKLGGTQLVWAPASAFVDTSKPDGRFRVLRRAGYVRYRFEGPSFTHELVEPARFISHDMRNWMMQAGSTTRLPARPLPSAS